MFVRPKLPETPGIWHCERLVRGARMMTKRLSQGRLCPSVALPYIFPETEIRHLPSMEGFFAHSRCQKVLSP